ncbi:MAG: antibiotic biosynthesis monooxygenase family protein [Actinomycetes bacterium]
MLQVVTRYRVSGADTTFRDQAAEAVEALSQHDGFVDASLARAVDDAGLWVLLLRWASVGAYRRALSSYDVKVGVVPLLSRAVDEPTAFEVLHRRDATGSVDATSDLAG